MWVSTSRKVILYSEGHCLSFELSRKNLMFAINISELFQSKNDLISGWLSPARATIWPLSASLPRSCSIRHGRAFKLSNCAQRNAKILWILQVTSRISKMPCTQEALPLFLESFRRGRQCLQHLRTLFLISFFIASQKTNAQSNSICLPSLSITLSHN